MSEKNSCITCLPITPVIKPNLGLLVIPFVLDVLGNRLNLKKVLSINTNGLKLLPGETEKALREYISISQKIGIEINHVWHDDQASNIEQTKKLFTQLVEMGYVTREETEIRRCPCGAVEMLASAKNWSERRKVYRSQNGQDYCKLCKHSLATFNETAYLFCFPEIEQTAIQVQPAFYSKDLEQLIKRFSGCRLLVSRHRQSKFPLLNKQEDVFLDVDFAWCFQLPLLDTLGYQPEIVVGSLKNLMACYFMATISWIFNRHIPAFVITPYCYAEQHELLKNAFSSADEFTKKYGRQTTRLFLSSGLNWRQKESTIEARLLPLLEKLSYRIKSLSRKYNTIEEALSDFDGMEIKRMIGQVRKTRDEHGFEKLSGII